ncbi:hypothetical protein HUW46_06714 [Amycolatopsis sp. CA-230715]|nr:serine protease [Amycolatopsis sp. CA-230715]QWF83274.1 hypothetical protein HUW46_06714 [Amycolatopsis sp. CA-230715]
MAFKNFRPAMVAAATVLLVLGVVVSTDTTTGDAIDAEATANDAYTTSIAAKTATTTPAASPSVGALFSDGEHFCSGSVVHSPAGDVVLTAAHCVNDGDGTGNHDGLTFAPGYHDGVAPYGMWTATVAAVPAGWASGGDPDLDFAFLTVRQEGTPASVESLTGANTLGTHHGFTNLITLTGYPDDADAPVVCQGVTTRSGTYQQRVECPGFPDGTSGGPWVIDVDAATGDGTVIGVIGGYQYGGDSPDVSYSSYFDSDIKDLYDSVTG